MKRYEKACCTICLTLLMFFFSVVIVRTFTAQVLVKHYDIHNAFTDAILFDIQILKDGEENDSSDTIDWSTLYPFRNGVKTEEASESKNENRIDQIELKIDGLRKKVDSYTSNYLLGYRRIVDWAKKYEDAVRWNYVSYSEYNGVVRTSDGYFTTLWAEKDVKACADSTKSLSDYCESNGIDFLYVNAPTKVCRETDTDISGVNDFSNQNADRFLSLLKSTNVNFYDLRNALHEEGRNHHSMFYRTDHHWLPETGLWAVGRIVSVLNNDFGFIIDPSYADPKNYTAKVYPKWFLGSQGKKVTLSSADAEDFSLLYPTFETLLHYEVKSKDISADGDFSITYDMDCVKEKDYYNLNPYDAYMYGIQPLEKFENKLVDNGHHILVVHDSFGNSVVPFLALGIQYVDSIDLRRFNGSLQTYIEIEHPDAVLLLYHSGQVDGSLIKDGGIFDFK